VRILLTFDTGYAPHAATVMESVICNSADRHDFAVIYYDLDAGTQSLLKQHFADRVKSLVFYQLDSRLQARVPKATRACLTANMYLRYFAPVCLPDDEFVLYFDCDIVVLKDVNLLMQEAARLGDYPVYAVEDLYEYIPDTERYLQRLCLDLKTPLLNSGVMLINVKQWREKDLTNLILNYLTENIDWIDGDQCALNACLKGNFGVLSPKWNGFGKYTDRRYIHKYLTYSAEYLLRERQNPAVIHYTGSLKPWHYAFPGLYRDEYLKYRRLTPWAKVEYKDRTIKNMLTVNAKRIAIAILGLSNYRRIAEALKSSV